MALPPTPNVFAQNLQEKRLRLGPKCKNPIFSCALVAKSSKQRSRAHRWMHSRRIKHRVSWLCGGGVFLGASLRVLVHTQPLVAPVVHGLVPELGVLRFQDPVAFVGE